MERKSTLTSHKRALEVGFISLSLHKRILELQRRKGAGQGSPAPEGLPCPFLTFSEARSWLCEDSETGADVNLCADVTPVSCNHSQQTGQVHLQHKLLRAWEGEVLTDVLVLVPAKHGVICSPTFTYLSDFLHGPFCLHFQRIHPITPLIEIMKTDSFNKGRAEQQWASGFPFTTLPGNQRKPIFSEYTLLLARALLWRRQCWGSSRARKLWNSETWVGHPASPHLWQGNSPHCWACQEGLITWRKVCGPILDVLSAF